MVDERTVLVLAQLPREERHALMAETAAAAFEQHPVESLGAAVLSLATRPPAAVLVDLELPEAQELCVKVRTKRRSVDVALFGMAREVTADTFAEALRWGVDDVTSLRTEGALASRLIALPEDLANPPVARGDAVVATGDDGEFIIGRMLTNAGYEVEYARDPITLQQLASLERMRLVVTTPRVGNFSDLIQAARRRGGNATWIVISAPDDVAIVERALTGVPRAGVVSRADPFEHILFASNELAGSAADARRERRVLHGALVRFGSSPDGPFDHGYTYNVSPGGLYVRTLAPPKEDEIHVQVVAPNSNEPLHLIGKVAWRRGFARLGTATAPPGFGLQIAGGDEAHRAAWARGCTQLLVARRAPQKPPRPPGKGAAPPPQARPEATEEVPRISQIEELDDAFLDSVQPDSIRMIEEAAARSEAASAEPTIPRAPAVPRLSPAETPPQAAIAGSAPQRNAPTAGPGDTDAATSPRSSAALGPASASTAEASAAVAAPTGPAQVPLQQPDRAVQELKSPAVAPAAQPAPSPRKESAPTVAEAPRPKHAGPGADTRQADRPGPSAAQVSPPAAQSPRRTGCSIAIGLAVGSGLALLTVIGIVVVGKPWGTGATNSTQVTTRPGDLPTTPPPSATSHDLKPPVPAPPDTSKDGPEIADAGDDETKGDDAGVPEDADSPEDVESGDDADTRDETEAGPDATSESPEAPASAEPPPEPDVTEVPEGELNHYEAYFWVDSSASTHVFSNGIDVGPTNAKNKVRCGLRNVRLGDAPGKWRSEGRTVQIECAKHNRVRVEPTQ